jgi:hypothetical protein
MHKLYGFDKGNELVACHRVAYYFRQANLPRLATFINRMLRMKPIVISLIKNFMLLSVCVLVLAACDDSAMDERVTDSITQADSKY